MHDSGRLTRTPDDQSSVLLSEYLTRNRKLQTWAWLSVAIPVAVFIAFSVLTIREARKYVTLNEKIRGQEQTISDQQQKIAQQLQTIGEQQNRIAIGQTAIGYVSQQSPGPRPKVDLYRKPPDQVLNALQQLGYPIEIISPQANPNLKDLPVDTLEYGCGVSNEDIRTLAVALLGTDLSVRRIGPAMKKPDSHLVQLIASRKTSEMGLSPMTLGQIKAWSRPDKTCGS